MTHRNDWSNIAGKLSSEDQKNFQDLKNKNEAAAFLKDESIGAFVIRPYYNSGILKENYIVGSLKSDANNIATYVFRINPDATIDEEVGKDMFRQIKSSISSEMMKRTNDNEIQDDKTRSAVSTSEIISKLPNSSFDLSQSYTPEKKGYNHTVGALYSANQENPNDIKLTPPLLLREVRDHQWEQIENLVKSGHKGPALLYYISIVQNPKASKEEILASFHEGLKNRGFELGTDLPNTSGEPKSRL